MLIPFLTASAWASAIYPTDLEADLGMPCTPACTVCHESLAGGGGTVTQAFGMALMDRGLTGGSNSGGLATALDTLTNDGVDSDGDGVIDTDELIAGSDPNPGGVDFCAGPTPLTPHYGCGASTRPGPALGWLVAGLALGLGLSRRA